MKKHPLTNERIDNIADYFAKQNKMAYGDSEYKGKVDAYLMIYNSIREELENYNANLGN